MDYDSTSIARTYDAGRDLPARKKQQLLEFFVRHAAPGEIAVVIDLGCGTGRFSEALAEAFDARVFAIDPSEKMLAQARLKTRSDRVSFELAPGEALPFDRESVDMVFMSMVFHHLSHPDRVLGECARLLRRGKYACVRNTTADEISSYPYLDFFPGIETIIEQSLLSRERLTALFSAAGFEAVAQETTWHEIAPDWRAFVDKITLRADSFVARLADDAFESGLLDLRKHAARAPENQKVGLNLDQFVFRRL